MERGGTVQVGKATVRSRLIAGALVLAVLSGGGAGSTQARAEGTERAQSWISISSTRPGAGCSVDVGVEVRRDGGPVAGLPVQIAYAEDGSDASSVDDGVTDADGIVTLTFDTSGAPVGVSGWLDVNVDGAYIKGASIVPTASDDCGAEPVLLQADAVVSGTSGTSPETSDAVLVPDIPAYKQVRSLSCEYAAVYIATAAFGDPIDEEDYIAEMPLADNPHFGYRGNIDGEWGRTDDYGIYVEALVPNLEQHGYDASVAYEPTAAYLRSQLDAGRPVVVWISARGDTGFYEQDADGNSFKLVPYEHVVVAYGYDDAGVYISDPGSGVYTSYSWEWFIDAWTVLDGMSLSISPAR